MLNKTGFFVVDEIEAKQAIAERGRAGWRIFELPARISSKDEFFEGVRRTLPLDPPLSSNRSWEALADSRWPGLEGMPEQHIVVVWPERAHMEVQAPNDFATATDVLAELPTTLADAEGTNGVTKQVLILRVI